MAAAATWFGAGCDSKVQMQRTETAPIPPALTVEVKTNMPPGWRLQTDGKEWRWVDANGGSWLPLSSRERAIKNAWEHYNYKPPEWKETQ